MSKPNENQNRKSWCSILKILSSYSYGISCLKIKKCKTLNAFKKLKQNVGMQISVHVEYVKLILKKNILQVKIVLVNFSLFHFDSWL